MASKKPIYDTAIQVRIKRMNETLFVVCDEFESIAVLKGRYLNYLNQIGFKMDKQEEDLTIDDIRLNLKKRVSFTFKLILLRFSTTIPLATTSRCLTTRSCMRS